MKGKLLYSIFVACLLYAGFSVAVADQCPDISNSTECKNTAGCEYDATQGECVYCNTGHYCPNNGCNNETGACPCPDNFPSSFPGSTSVNGCFAEVDCPDWNNEHIHAGISYTTNTIYFLAPIVNNGFWDADDNDHKWPANNSNLFYNIFHLEVATNNNNLTFSCENNSSECNEFRASDGDCNSMTGTAQWVYDDIYHWDVSNCECKKNTEIEDKNCRGEQIFSAVTPQTNVTHIGDEIEFKDTADSYYCNHCIPDDNSHVYYADTNYGDSPRCTINLNSAKVCKCIALTTKGSYRTGRCDGTVWSSQDDICLKKDCPIGQTTDDILATDPSACKYGANTQICDAYGCKNLNDVLNNSVTWQSMLQ